MQFLNLVRRQAKAQIAKRGGGPEACEFGRIDGVDGRLLSRAAARRCSALRFERSALTCIVRNCRSRGGGMRLKGRACAFIPLGRSSIAIAPRPATRASLS